MERESNPMESHCRSGCGFYGNPATEGLCSKCFKETLKKKQQPPNPPPSANSNSTATLAIYQGSGNTPSSPFTNSQSSAPYQSVVQTSAPCRIPIVRAAEFIKEAVHNSNLDEASGNNGPELKSAPSLAQNWNNTTQKWDLISSGSCARDHDLASSGASSELKSSSGRAEIWNNSAESWDLASSTRKETIQNLASSSSSDESVAGKKKKLRCLTCRKKVGLTGFGCRCGGLYCSTHRYSDEHDCTFNYRELGAAEIRRNNPVVVGEKIQKI